MAQKRQRPGSGVYHHSQQTLTRPHWSYFRLSTFPSASADSQPPLDATTARWALQQALSTYLGDHGAAIPIDMLKVEHGPQCCDVIVRVPHQDRDAFAAAVSSAGLASRVAMRVKTSSDWLSGLVPTPPDGLFDFE